MDEEHDKSTVSLSVSVSADRDLFARRTCPKCGLDFKILADDNNISWLLNEQIKRQGSGIGISPVEESDSKDEIIFCCPYCESVFDSKESFTEETINYARRITYRDVVLPMINKMFGDLEDSLGGHRSSGGFFSISISFEHNRQAKPPRPFHEPEPADMKIVHFLCCGRKAKIMENWISTKLCIYCRTEIALT